MDIEKLTIIGGVGKSGRDEPVTEVELAMGNVVSIVGPTGSGKTTLINDIELFADGNTPSRRRILINGSEVSSEWMEDPSKNPIARITQHTNFLSDMQVYAFLTAHGQIRGRGRTGLIVQETLDFANELTGEPIAPNIAMTELSGGQTRALLIADAVVIGNSPIILLDEIENAGIHRTRALELLRKHEKIFVFVTHDPHIALLSDFRIVMKQGQMEKLIVTDDEERDVAEEIRKMDTLLLELRHQIREGCSLVKSDVDRRLRVLGYVA
jgi:ABC-type lipoprotein export system ATPase subunit